MPELLLPLMFYVAGLAHHAWALYTLHRETIRAVRFQRQMEMLDEAIALAKYGASEEAESLIREAVNLERMR